MSETTKTTERLLAFRARTEYTKEFFSGLTHQHQDADILKAGSYESCSVGCLNKSIGNDGSDHAALARDMGVAESIIHLADRLFEGLQEDQRLGWHVRWVKAIPDGSDTSLFRPRFLGKMLRELLLLPDVSANAELAIAINGVIALMDGWIETGQPDEEAARASRAASRAAEWAAASAGWAESALAASWVASWAARSAEAAMPAAEAAMAAASAGLPWERIADMMVEAIGECPVVDAGAHDAQGKDGQTDDNESTPTPTTNEESERTDDPICRV